VSLFRREPLHAKLARALQHGDGVKPAWREVGIHGLQRPREWDEVRTVESDLPGEEAHFVVLDDEILVEGGPEGAETLADTISLAPPYRAEAVRRQEGVWAVAARKITVVRLDGVDGDEVELTLRDGERTLFVDGNRAFGTIPALERDGDFSVRARRLDGDRWEVEASLL
jgi:hypothetical protein